MENQQAQPSLLYAGFVIRLAAHLIDRFLFIIPLLLIGIALPPSEEVLVWTAYSNKGIAGIVTAGIYYLYLTISTRYYQKAVGKRIFGLQLVREDQQPIGWGRAITREVFARIVSEVFFLGYLYCLVNKKRQTFHDRVTSIVVIQEKLIDGNSRKMMRFIIIVLPLTVTLLSFGIYYRYIRLQDQKWALIEKIEEKMLVLKAFSGEPYRPCRNYHSQLQAQLEAYCPPPVSENRICLAGNLSETQLVQISHNAEQMIYDCVKAQSDYHNQRNMGR